MAKKSKTPTTLARTVDQHGHYLYPDGRFYWQSGPLYRNCGKAVKMTDEDVKEARKGTRGLTFGRRLYNQIREL